MPPYDLSKILESKKALKEEMRNLPVAEKMQILEKLRDRSLEIAAAGLKIKPSDAPKTPSED